MTVVQLCCSLYKYSPSCSRAAQRFSSLMPVYHILIVGNSNIFSASPTIGTITSYNIKISERRLFWIFIIEYFIFINSPKCLAQRQKHPSLPSLSTLTWFIIIEHQCYWSTSVKRKMFTGQTPKRDCSHVVPPTCWPQWGSDLTDKTYWRCVKQVLCTEHL